MSGAPNYSNLQNGITETTVYLEKFFRGMLLGEEYEFRNRELHIDWKKEVQDSLQSANNALKSLPKSKICTLEEMAVLRFIKINPRATQKEIAREIGKSERTVKSITVKLQEKELLKRVGSKRDGHWKYD